MPAAVLEKPEVKTTEGQKQVYRAPVALYENGESYIALVELPGADEKAVQVHIENSVLTIEAPLKLELPPGAIVKYSELCLGNYRRTLDLADQIDEENIEGSFKNGLLKLTLPKSRTAKARKIAVKTV